MKVLVLGAGGKTGSAVVRRAVDAGHQVTAFVHHADGYHGPSGVTVKEGDATDAAAVASAVAGQDAVIDTIGGKTPYKSGISLEQDVATAVIAAMQRHAVRRLVATSSLGVGDSMAHASTAVRVLTKTFLRGSTADKAAMEANIEASGLDWTVVRPAVLSDAAPTGEVRVLDDATDGKAGKLPRADLAAWLVAQLDDSAYIHRSVTLATT